MNLDVLAIYLATWLLVALTPGPAVLCAVTQATRHDLRSARLLRSGKIIVWLERALGTALVGFGVRLLATPK